MTSCAAVSNLWRPTSARKSCRLSPAPEALAVATGSGVFFSRSASARGSPVLEPDRPELAGQLVDLVLVQLELEGERLQLGRLDIAALFGAGDDRARLLSLE